MLTPAPEEGEKVGIFSSKINFPSASKNCLPKDEGPESHLFAKNPHWSKQIPMVFPDEATHDLFQK